MPAGDRLVERRLDLRIGEPGAEPHLGLDLERLAEVLDRLVALLVSAEGHDPQRHVRARPDRMQREARPLGDLERLVEELHRRLELQVLVGVDGLAIEQSDLADRRAVSIFRLDGPRQQHRGEGARPSANARRARRLLPTACRDTRRFARFNNNAERHTKDSPETRWPPSVEAACVLPDPCRPTRPYMNPRFQKRRRTLNGGARSTEAHAERRRTLRRGKPSAARAERASVGGRAGVRRRGGAADLEQVDAVDALRELERR